jgi:hypothetical protein
MTQVTLNGLLDAHTFGNIPEEFRCNPYDVSPSGDPFFADRRNVEYVEHCCNDARDNNSMGTVLNNKKDIERYFKERIS